MNRYAVGERAIADMDEIWAYIADHDVQAADRLIRRFFDTFEMLGQQPDLGESVGYLTSGLRRKPIGNYVVYFEIEPDHVWIRRVIHGARDIRKFFGGDE